MGVQEQGDILAAWTPHRHGGFEQAALDIARQVRPAGDHRGAKAAQDLLLFPRLDRARIIGRQAPSGEDAREWVVALVIHGGAPVGSCQLQRAFRPKAPCPCGSAWPGLASPSTGLAEAPT